MQGFRGDTLIVESWFPERAAFTSEQRFELTRLHIGSHELNSSMPRGIGISIQIRSWFHARWLNAPALYLPTLRYAEDYEFLMRIADRTEWVVFCDKTVARYRLPEEGSHSVSMGRLEQHLQSLAAAQHLRATARSRERRERGGQTT